MKLAVFLICVAVVVLAIGFVEWVKRKYATKTMTMIGVGVGRIEICIASIP